MWADENKIMGVSKGLLVYLRQKVNLPGYPDIEVENLLVKTQPQDKSYKIEDNLKSWYGE